MKRALLVAATVAAALTSCTDLPEDDPSRVLRLRALAVKAEPAEPQPGDTVTLSALIADPRGEDSTRTFEWTLCLPLLAGAPEELADAASCVEPANQLALGSGATLTWVVPAETLDGLTPERAMAGIELPVLLTVRGRGGRRDDALKRVRVSTNPAPNGNPTLGALEIDGSAAGANTTLSWNSRHGLDASATDPDGTDSVTLEFLVSAGTVPNNERPAGSGAEWELRGARPAAATVWIVGRDLRGGIDWTSATVTIIE